MNAGYLRKEGVGILYKQVSGLYFVLVIPDVGEMSYVVFSTGKALARFVASFDERGAA